MSEEHLSEKLEIAARVLKLQSALDQDSSRREREICATERQKLCDLWAKRHGVKQSNGRADWWGKLIRNVPVYQAAKLKLPEKLPSDDHVSLWIKNGKPHFWVSQPYNLHLREMVEAADEYGLQLNIDTFPSWYYPTLTHLIVWSRRDDGEGA